MGTKLNSYNDWSPLKEIIVGSAANYVSHERDLTFDLFYHENLFRSDWAYPRLTSKRPGRSRTLITQRYVDELNEDVEGFASKLRSLQISVLRPITLCSNVKEISGLGWDAAPTPALNIRDNTLIIGNEIIETPPAIRSRYLETRLLSNHFYNYWSAGASWTTMPRPLLTDCSFDRSYALRGDSTLGGPTEPIHNPKESPYDVGFEMMLDGAQCLRIGQDLIVNIANKNHELACDWLERHLSHQYRIHRVACMSDNHIDSMILALKPGVFLCRHVGIQNLMPRDFQKWKFIIPPEPTRESFPSYNDADLVLTSPYIDLNVLSIDENTIVVNESCLGLIQVLEAEGFNIIPVRHRHRRLFGGGFHCFTLDTVREGDLVDYR